MENKYNLNLREGTDFFLKQNHWLPKLLGVKYLAFHKTLFSRNSTSAIPKHEFLHIAQFNKYGISRVVMHYLFHLSKNYIHFKDIKQGFSQIPFEVEAKQFESMSDQ